MRLVRCKNMKLSAQTRKYKFSRFLFILTWILCFGTAVAFIISCVAGIEPSPAGETMKEKLGTVIYGFGLSLIPVAVICILVKDKIRPTVWMLNVILANYLYDSVGLYIVVAIWFLAEYIIMPISKRCASLYMINKEMDKRGL